jgi:TRAP-type C4-dicarboxylate transport system permease small subunit
MRRLNSLLTGIFERFLMVVMAVLVIDVVWQVFTRYVLGHQSSWTEELATMLLMWGSLFGACVAFARGEHLGFDYFVKKLEPRSQQAAEKYVYAITALFGAILSFGGYQLVAGTLASNQLSAALGIRMGYVYLAVPLSGVFILLLSLEKTVSPSGGAGPHR